MSSDFGEGQAQSSISQLLRAVGGWGGPGGPGLFMFRSLIVGSSTSAIVGLSAASITSAFAGPAALAFAIGSSIGFVGGMIHYYRLSVRSASRAMDQFPSLMRLHLRANYPLKNWDGMEINGATVNETWELQSCAIAAWESAGPALQELNTRRESDILGELAAARSASTNDS